MGIEKKEINSEKTFDLLSKLLHLMKVKHVYYIDDENNLTDLDIEFINVEIEKIFYDNNESKIFDLGLEDYEADIPREGATDYFIKLWKKIGYAEKVTLYEKLLKISNHNELQIDFERAKKLETQIPSVISLSPLEWEQQKNDILKSISNDEFGLFLFDEDLQLAGAKYKITKGQDLIVDLKRGNPGNIVCALLTHTIQEIKDELPSRKRIIEKRIEGDLEKKDFFPLAKIRLDNPSLFADGIKKTIINNYYENIKSESLKIIENSFSNARDLIQEYDTYDFEDTISKSSLLEGLWEPETLFRIFRIKFDNELKRSMVNTGYVKTVNKEFKETQKCINIKFSIPTHPPAYLPKYELRYSEIYDEGILINPIRKPLENGDIFNFNGGLYILIAQPCDLMIRGRNKKRVKRNLRLATFLKIVKKLPYKKKSYEDMLKDSLSNFNEYPLEYFNRKDHELFVVEFKNPLMIDLEVLDLCVLNSNGACTINIIVPETEVAYLSATWEERFSLIKQNLRNLNTKLKIVRKGLKVNSPVYKLLLKKHIPSLVISPHMNKLSLRELNVNGELDYKVIRDAKLKEPFCNNLLEKYSRYLSRSATAHDFTA